MDYKAKSKFAIEIGKRIKEVREKAGLTQEELAFKVDVDRTYIGYIENGKYSPSAYIIWRLSKELKVPIELLFKF